MDNKYKIIYVKFIYIIILSIVVICSLFYSSIIFGDSIKSTSYIYSTENNIKYNNLSLPFPNSYNLKSLNVNYFDKSLQEFHQELIKNYYYDENYDCNYWSFVWGLYWKQNKDKYNWSIKFIDTDNHVFVMVYNLTGYCIMDQVELICMSQK